MALINDALTRDPPPNHDNFMENGYPNQMAWTFGTVHHEVTRLSDSVFPGSWLNVGGIFFKHDKRFLLPCAEMIWFWGACLFPRLASIGGLLEHEPCCLLAAAFSINPFSASPSQGE